MTDEPLKGRVSMTWHLNIGAYQHVEFSVSEDYLRATTTAEQELDRVNDQIHAWMDKTGLKPKVWADVPPKR